MAKTAEPDHLEKWTLYRSLLARNESQNLGYDPDDLRQKLRAARLADHIERWLAGTPKLTDAQRVAIARILTEGGDPDASA